MNIRYIKKLVFIAIILSSFYGLSQRNFESLGESAFLVNHKFSEKYAVNFALESRYFLYQNSTFKLKQRQVDLAHFSTLNLNYTTSISLGIEYRNRELFNNIGNELRITQQFNYATQKQGMRFGHRIRSEQRYFKTHTVFRQRYRFTIDFPLNGEKLDVGEAYFVGSLEGLLYLSKVLKPELGQRTTTQIGWQFTENLKLQLGLEYRLEAVNIETEKNLFILTSAILKI